MTMRTKATRSERALAVAKSPFHSKSRNKRARVELHGEGPPTSRRVPFTLTLYQTVLYGFDDDTIDAEIWRLPEDLAVGCEPQQRLTRGNQQVILTCVEMSEAAKESSEINFGTRLLLWVNDVDSVSESYKHTVQPNECVLEREDVVGLNHGTNPLEEERCHHR